MKADRAIYASSRLAAGYAFSRPSVHPQVLARARAHLTFSFPVARALDIGCGAGKSTAALEAFAVRVFGIDPVALMLEQRRVVAPGAAFAVAECERLPFPSSLFDIVTAAGSINYTDWSMSFPEIARVLAPSGVFLMYDFSAGRRLRDDDRLGAWFAEFERRFPEPAGYAIDPRSLPLEDAGLTLYAYDDVEVGVPLTLDSYLRYVLSETRVEHARLAGTEEEVIRRWCRAGLQDILGDEPRDVVFPAYAACIRRTG